MTKTTADRVPKYTAPKKNHPITGGLSGSIKHPSRKEAGARSALTASSADDYESADSAAFFNDFLRPTENSKALPAQRNQTSNKKFSRVRHTLRPVIQGDVALKGLSNEKIRAKKALRSGLKESTRFFERDGEAVLGGVGPKPAIKRSRYKQAVSKNSKSKPGLKSVEVSHELEWYGVARKTNR